MTCTEARELLLVADRTELAPDAATELGAHLRSCAPCRAAAAEIAALESGLAGWLAARQPSGDASAALARAATIARRRRHARRIGAAAGLAAAAIAVLLQAPGAPPRSSAPPGGRVEAVDRGFSVSAPPGRDLVVLQPADTNVVIVWYLPPRRM